MFSSTTKTHFYIRLTDKKLVSNGEECSQKDGIHNTVILIAIDYYSLTLVDTVLLQDNSDTTFC